MPTRQQHWQDVYLTKSDTDVSWFQPNPELSLALIRDHAPEPNASVIDIGGGTSSLAADLLKQGYKDLSVLDISSAALDRAKKNMGADAVKVQWIVADITAWKPLRRWSVWHDRAVFHFLTSADSQDAYILALKTATESGAIAIISGFALDGPEKCSGLPVVRYDAKTLSLRIGNDFELLAERREQHRTPGGTLQSFYYAVLRRR